MNDSDDSQDGKLLTQTEMAYIAIQIAAGIQYRALFYTIRGGGLCWILEILVFTFLTPPLLVNDNLGNSEQKLEIKKNFGNLQVLGFWLLGLSGWDYFLQDFFRAKQRHYSENFFFRNSLGCYRIGNDLTKKFKIDKITLFFTIF